MSDQPPTEEVSWALEEFAQVSLKDERLNQRCRKLADTLGQQPPAPINQACEDWADSKAAYRFFANPKVAPGELLAPHSQRTVARMPGHPVVLAVIMTATASSTANSRRDFIFLLLGPG